MNRPSRLRRPTGRRVRCIDISLLRQRGSHGRGRSSPSLTFSVREMITSVSTFSASTRRISSPPPRTLTRSRRGAPGGNDDKDVGFMVGPWWVGTGTNTIAHAVAEVSEAP
jgi:hypothetical protein